MGRDDIILFTKQVYNKLKSKLSSQLLFYTFNDVIDDFLIAKGNSAASKH